MPNDTTTREQSVTGALYSALRFAASRSAITAADEAAIWEAWNTRALPADDAADQPTAPDDLVERLLTQADGSRTPSLLKEAAASIKELKAEVERWCNIAAIRAEYMVLLYDAKVTAEARAAKAEEALREIAGYIDRYGKNAKTAIIGHIAKKHLGEGKA